MTRLILVSDLYTERNLSERFRVRADIDIDEVGLKQAEATAKRISEWQISAIYSSPLRRALSTARILARLFNLDVKPLPDISDIDYGEWQGLSSEETLARYPDLHSIWLNSPHKVGFPSGESLADVRRRTSIAVDNLITQHQKETIVMVSHKAVCQIIALSLMGLDNSFFWEITQDVGAINVFEVRGGIPSVLLLNDTCHLKAPN